VIRPTPELLQQWASISRSHPAILEWITEWRQRELDQLPYVGADASHLAQGRCQVLTEIYKLVQNAPDMAAESRKR
jgi:hypothetical protein